jgi:hypothetical protein
VGQTKTELPGDLLAERTLEVMEWIGLWRRIRPSRAMASIIFNKTLIGSGTAQRPLSIVGRLAHLWIVDHLQQEI